MEEISQIIDQKYEKAKLVSRSLYLLSLALLILPLCYETSIGSPHIRALQHLSAGSIFVVMIFLSGVCFGYSLYYTRVIIKRMKEMF